MTEIILYGVIGDPTDKLDAATVCAAIRGATGPLAIRINSPGGYVMEGLAIVQALRDYSGQVTIHIDGLAASMASVIAMVGTEIIMAESALMMIHKPWDSSIGNADDMRRDAAMLDKIEQQLIGIYSQRTGLDAKTLAAMLAAETWMTAEEALASRFVTTIATPLRIAAMADVTACGFRNIPLKLKERTMTTPASAGDVLAIERSRISTILALGAKHRLPDTMIQNMVSGGISLENARAAILDHLASEGDRAGIGHNSPANSHVTLDNPSTYNEAIRDALTAKICGKRAEGPASEFKGMSVTDIARDWLARHGERDVHRIAPERVIAMAMRPMRESRPSYGFNAITHTTSDFPDLIGSASEKYLVDRYKLQESPLKQLARERSRSNFLMQYGIQMSGMGVLDQVGEAAEFKYRTLSTRKEGYKIDTFGDLFSVSRQMLVNDALGALADVLNIMAAAAAETEALILVTLINSNIALNDGTAWFHANHKNLAATPGVPSLAGLDAGRLAMRTQKDIDGVGAIDANPKFLLVPAQLQTQAETLVTAIVSPTTPAEVNPFAGKLVPVVEPRLTSATAWYLFTDPLLNPALQYSYLDGQSAPFLDSKEGWNVDGTEYKVRHDFGAGVLDHRFAWKNAG